MADHCHQPSAISHDERRQKSGRRRHLVSGGGGAAGGRGRSASRRRRSRRRGRRRRSRRPDRAACRADVLGAGRRARVSPAARSRSSTSPCWSGRLTSSASRACRCTRPADSTRRSAWPLIDAECARGDRRAPPQVIHHLPAAHAREHSLEMQLPFLMHLAPGDPDRPAADGLSDRGNRGGAGRRAGDRAPRPPGAARSPAPICRTITTQPPRRNSTRRDRLRRRASTPTACRRRSTRRPSTRAAAGRRSR